MSVQGAGCEKSGVTYLTDRLGGEEEGVTLGSSVGVDHFDGRGGGEEKMQVREEKEGGLQKANCLGGTVDSYGGGWQEGRKLHHWIPLKWVESFDFNLLAPSAEPSRHCRRMLDPPRPERDPVHG
jgi:hypothetical protein